MNQRIEIISFLERYQGDLIIKLPFPDGWRTSVLRCNSNWKNTIDNIDKNEKENEVWRWLNISQKCFWADQILKNVGEGKVKIIIEKIDV